ncbi:MAG TPA: hypothetical protein VIN40_05570 [Candidatus Tyrphobacter sp.]
MFRQVDIEHMKPMGVALDDYKYMSDDMNAQAVYEFLTGKQEPKMPPGGPYWGQGQLDLLHAWMMGGRKP